MCEPLLPPVVERQKMMTELAVDCTACPPVHYYQTHTHTDIKHTSSHNASSNTHTI